MDQKTILVAFGGASPEHEVSVITSHQAIAALQESNYSITPLYLTKNGRWLTGETLLDLKNFEDLKKLEDSCTPCTFGQNEFGQPVLLEQKTGFFSKPKTTPIFAVIDGFHGSKGENGAFQGACEMFNIPCTGSGVMGSAIGMDKVMAKTICRANEIPVAESVDFFEPDWVDHQSTLITKIESLEYPVIVKPVHLGSSIGVEVVMNQESLIRAVEAAFKYDDHLLVETVITPLMEINCSVLGSSRAQRTSVCERPIGKEELLSFQDKYLNDAEAKGMASADREIPAKIPDELTKAIQETSVKVFKLLSCSGLARLDFLVNEETHQFYFNEINTIPGSFSFYLWKESGISFTDLLLELIDIAVEDQNQKARRIQSYDTNLLSQKAVKGIKGLKSKK
ncbi:D-alanine--D-alanine ligase family protein [Rhodohalobacter sp. 614A]|uniref:D-alanine--D-alanine ligase family protein n=1 Tax=Rhodohalobacter sp. 614A TaxID=2908649 RepID=UPI001F424CF4|nr:D-alanine--D-alanine ligase family protein [Rhodohalobacter sp. 614A]